MASVVRSAPSLCPDNPSDVFIDAVMRELRWQTVKVAISRAELRDNFAFLNDAVVLRPGREGVPLMTTTGIYGPILPETRVVLTPGEGSGVSIVSRGKEETSLIDALVAAQASAGEPDDATSTLVRAKWVSAADGGGIGDLGKASNVFGGTGQLLLQQPEVGFPVVTPEDPRYHDTLAYYGGRLLKPGEDFYMGFDLPLFGMEYDGTLPDYVRDYELSTVGGGGLFVEHHPFPHIWLPRPTLDGVVSCVSKITLGRNLENSPKEHPRYRFTTFRVPADGSALTIKPDTIHNDSYTNGPETVFLADTKANTVALRQTAPFTDILLNDVTPITPPL